MKLSKLDELLFLRKENIRLNKLVDQLMHNDYKGKSFYAYYDEIENFDGIIFDETYYIGLITITFDRKFVFFKKQEEQLNYIQQSIFKTVKDDYNIAFCIEHHKDGVLHAHMLIQHKINDIMSYTNVVNLRYELGLYFTDRETSFLTVRLDDVLSSKAYTKTGNTGYKGAIDYMSKEAFKFYKNI